MSMAKTATKRTETVNYTRLGFAFTVDDQELLDRIKARLQKRVGELSTVSAMATIRYALKHLDNCEK